MQRTELYNITEALGAAWSDVSGWTLPRSYGSVGDEVAACHHGAGIADVSDWGRFSLAGKDAARFLQGLVTNDVARLHPGDGCYSAILNTHGRIEADLWVSAVQDGYVLSVSPETTAYVDKFLGRYRLAGDFKFVSLAETHAAFALIGPSAPAMLGDMFGADLDQVGYGASRWTSESGETVWMLRVRRSAQWCTDVVGPIEVIRTMFSTFVARAGAVPIGTDALDVVRAEGGIPRFAVDFNNDTVLQEVDVPDIVSFHKGCYLGQEIVARIHFQGQPSKLLRRLEISGSVVPAPGDEVVARADEKPAGTVTTSIESPTFGPIVFATIKRKFYEPGTAVRIRHADQPIDAIVASRNDALQCQETS